MIKPMARIDCISRPAIGSVLLQRGSQFIDLANASEALRWRQPRGDLPCFVVL